MLFHVSIEADRPDHVAAVIAELWGSKALPFPPAGVGSWMAFANDDRSTIVEVRQRHTERHHAAGRAAAMGVLGAPHRFGATHLSIGTPLPLDAVLAIARREDWPAKVCNRGGKFHVIEIWIEGCQVVEFLTDDMQREYREAVTIESWEKLLSWQYREAA